MDARRLGTATDRAIARMLAEPTGRHFLDSGGAYGRNWERNQGMTVADWLATPEFHVEAWNTSTVDDQPGVEISDDAVMTLSTFHYLRQRLEFHPGLTGWLIKEGNRTEDPWLASMEQWCEARHDSHSEYWDLASFNSYNNDNLLSTVIQGVRFTYRDEPWVALQIHGGADVRGGYTTPKVFRVTTDEAWSFFDWNDWTMEHEHVPYVDAQEPLPTMPVVPDPERHAWDYRSGEMIDYGGSFVRLEDYASHGHLAVDGKSLVWQRTNGGPWRPRCPLDGEVCEVYAASAW